MRKHYTEEMLEGLVAPCPKSRVTSNGCVTSVLEFFNAKQRLEKQNEKARDRYEIRTDDTVKTVGTQTDAMVANLKETIEAARQMEADLRGGVEQEAKQFETMLVEFDHELQENKSVNATNPFEFTKRLEKDKKELKGTYTKLRETLITYAKVEQQLKACEKKTNSVIPKVSKASSKEVLDKFVDDTMDDIIDLKTVFNSNKELSEKKFSELKARYNEELMQASLIVESLLVR